MIKWWGYLHKDGTLHLKRYFDRRDIQEATESPFVRQAWGPFQTDDIEEAHQMLRADAAEYEQLYNDS